jgi:phenylalanyl-tRNA synthetase alpha chain
MEQQLAELKASALARIAAVSTPDELEAIRIEVAGRKGSALAELGKGMGKLPAEEKVKVGKLLNETKTAVESALDARKAVFEEAALNARLESEWLDITLPAPGIRPARCTRSRSCKRKSRSCSRRWASRCSRVPRSRPSSTTSTR